ncbi:MAG: flagellar export chaperone FliS [Sulfurospirillum sp.]|nr:flagellar export chaperone FliS [Sulfurospirillum sp.]MBL0703418.1 flagellar export chaperone FliS [Sulfurospirillum sp.]
MKSNLAYAAYSQNNVSIESPEKLIKILYEGILKFTSQAKKSIESENREKKVYWINRATAIFLELINSLNYDSGDVAHYLNGLYTRQIQLLAEANINDNIKKLDEVINVTRVLLNTWNEETGYAVVK